MPPCAIQLPFSLVHRSWAEDPATTEVLRASGAAVIASFSLPGRLARPTWRSCGISGRRNARARAAVA